MYNAKPTIATALSTDSALIALIPKVRMFSSVAGFTGAPVYPYLTYFILADAPATFADDDEIEQDVTIRLDLWSTTSLSVVSSHIDRIMKTIGYGRNWAMNNDEILDTGVMIRHTSMSFSGVFTFTA